jgi:hypothetical protein
MTTLQEIASEYPDAPGEIEAHELEGIEEYVSGASVYLSDTDASKVDVYLHIQESLEFHAEYEQQIFSTHEYYRLYEPRMFERTGDSEHDWTLTELAFEAIQDVLPERYGAEYFDMAGDVISFDMHLSVDANTEVSELTGIFWEESQIVRFMNESDPGTFGNPYLFGSIMSEAMKARES